MNENLVNLVRLLQFHDWYFDYTEDFSVWKKGMAQRDAINQEQKRLVNDGLATEEEVQKLIEKYAPKG